MKRRDFIASLSGSALSQDSQKGGNTPRTQTGLTPLSGNLDKRKALHLIRRLNFAPTNELLSQIVGKTAAAAVDLLLGTGMENLPEQPNAGWDTTIEENPLTVGNNTIRFEIEGRIRNRYTQFIDWWLEQMRTAPLPSREKITLFWSTVWCINFQYDTQGLLPVPLLFKNNQTMRRNSIGNYKPFAVDITTDGAMLLYQSLFYSSKEAPNENYMRELMELFTMGIFNFITGDPNYTEADIKEGSRILTGWRTHAYKYQENTLKGDFETYFFPPAHDCNAKEFMKTTFAARDQVANTEDQVLNQEVIPLINLLFEKKAQAISSFIAHKIYRYFVYSNPYSDDTAIISDLANVFATDWNIRALMQSLFTSEHFYDEANIGVQIKTPPEFLIGLEAQLGVKLPTIRDAMNTLDQVLYDPPNVGSWKAYRTWISTNTYPYRVKYANDMLALMSDANIITFAKKFDKYDSATDFVKNLEEYFFANPLETTRQERDKGTLLASAATNEAGWGALINAGDAKAAKAVRDLITEFFKAPDFQLT
jgi:uncharacterized protein (DUF1800 family)